MGMTTTTARVAARMREEFRVRHGAKSPPPMPWYDMALAVLAAAAVVAMWAWIIATWPSVTI